MPAPAAASASQGPTQFHPWVQPFDPAAGVAPADGLAPATAWPALSRDLGGWDFRPSRRLGRSWLGRRLVRPWCKTAPEVVSPSPGEIEGDPVEAVVVGVGVVAGPEAAESSEDGGSVPSAGLKVGEPAGLVPGDPEADQVGVFDYLLGDVLGDVVRVILDALAFAAEGLGQDIGREALVILEPVGACMSRPFGGVASFRPEIGSVRHSRNLAPTESSVKSATPGDGKGHLGRPGAGLLNCPGE
jgi:hypothetical protein